MKIVISHDIDHITAWEHKKDLIIPKFVVRGFVELGLGHISAGELLGRLKRVIKNKWHNLEEICTFDKKNSIPSTFFLSVSNGGGLAYSLEDSKFWTSRILDEGFDVGVHGVSHDDIENIKKEYYSLRRITRLEEIGMRMHNLDCNERTIELLSEANYLFDCSIVRMSNPYRINGMWEFPLQIMDTYIIERNTRWQSQNLNQSIETTKRILEEGIEKELSYFTILFHDIYFSDDFLTWKNWYTWLITYLQGNNLEFVSYRDAVNELEQELSNG